MSDSLPSRTHLFPYLTPINVINERSIAIDLDNEDELSELFDDIKVIFSGTR